MEGGRFGKRCILSKIAEESSSALPGEVVEGEILTRLPGRSLARFELVNKTWRSLICSPNLIRLCKRRGGVVEPEWSIEKLVARLSDLENKSRELLVPPWKALTVNVLAAKAVLQRRGIPEKEEERIPNQVVLQPEERLVVSVLGPTPDFGFYCLAASVKKSRLSYTETEFQSHFPYGGPASPHYYLLMSGRLALFNPATRATKLTNHFPPELRDPLFSRIVPWNTCAVHLGFGNLSSSFHHKVIVLIQYWPGEGASFESLVYSFVDDKWSNTLPPTASAGGSSITRIFDNKQSLLRGKWHWMALLDNGNNNSYGILSFDLGREEYKLIGGPPAYVDYCNRNPIHLVTDEEAEVCVLQERLTVIHMARVLDIYYLGIYMAKVDVFMMTEYGVQDSWVKLYTLHPDPPILDFIGCHMSITFIGIEYRGNANSVQRLYFKSQNTCVYRLDQDGYNVVRPSDLAKHSCWNFYTQTLQPL